MNSESPPVRASFWRLSLLLGLLGLALLSGCALSGAKSVTVRSVVDPAYALQREQRPPNAVETFVIAKGRTLMSSVYEKELSSLDFSSVARTIAADLKHSGYEPAAPGRAPELVIAVHLGVTSANERASDLLIYDPDNLRQAQGAVEEARAMEEADPIGARGAVAAAEADFRAEANYASAVFSGNDLQSASTADLLGFREVLQKENAAGRSTDAGETLRAMVDEERYFAVLIAYDARPARGGPRRRLWTTRLSITAAGQNFTTGLDRMSNAAAAAHGTPQVGILITPGHDRTAPVPPVEVTVLQPPVRPAAR